MKAFLSLFMALPLVAATVPESEQCGQVRFADIGWTDVAATTGVAAALLDALGYSTTTTMLAVPVTFASLKNADIDVFLGNWMPSMQADIAPYLRDGSVEILGTNLEGARYTLAVPKYVYEAGVRNFADLHKFEKQFKHRIYGIEPGNDGNRQIAKMIRKNDFQLKKWQLVESSEQAMLSEVKAAVSQKEWVVFLAWAPHPMNRDIQLQYLEGGDVYFGPNLGSSSVHTLVRKGYAQACPNVATLLRNLHFTVEMENELMSYILADKMSAKDAAIRWLRSHPKQSELWASGVMAENGSGVDAVARALSPSNQNSDDTKYRLPLGGIAESGVLWITKRFSPDIRAWSTHTETGISKLLETAMMLPSWLAVLSLTLLIQLWRRSYLLTIASALGLALIVNLGLWQETLQTLLLVVLSASVCMGIGVPLGILATRFPILRRILEPLLDLAQTIPTFVYLIPTLMLFGLGMVPGLISTIIFAIAAPIRLTYLGISSVPKPFLEASSAFGANSWQTLRKVELPHAYPQILLGLSQCIMLSLSMVVIAALVGAQGLGEPVVRALNTVNLRLGFEAGIAIVIVAMILDRTLQHSQRTSS